MASFSTNQFKPGLKLLFDGDPYTIVENEFVKPGKGQAFNRIKVRNLKTGRVIEKTLKSGESVEGADVVDTELQFLYGDGSEWHFMNPQTFDQIVAGQAALGEAAKWLKGQEMCVVTLWNDQPIAVTPLDPADAVGYRGGDEFAVVDSTLMRIFQVHEQRDEVWQPTAAQRRMRYSLAEARWIRED